MLQNDYDIIVIGAGVGGLSTAALLAKEGFKVIVLEQAETPGGRCGSLSRDGYLFDIGASIFWGFEKGGTFNSLFRKIGLYKDIVKKINLIDLDPGLQIILPNHRINIYSKRKMFFEELRREFQEESKNIIKFYEEIDNFDIKLDRTIDLPYSFDLKKKETFFNEKLLSLKKKISRGTVTESIESLLKKSKITLAMERFLDIQSIYFGQTNVLNSSQLFLSTILNIPKKGISYIQGGNRTLINTLAGIVKGYGGEICYNSKVEEILLDKKSIRGVKVNHKSIENDLLASCVICAFPIFSLASLIKSNKYQKKILKFFKNRYYKYIPFTVLLGVDEKVIPEPMKEHVFILRDYNAPLEDDNLIFLSISPSWDKTRTPIGKRAITASIFLSVDSFNIQNKKNFIKEKTDKIINNIEQTIPFLRNFIDLVIPIDPIPDGESAMAQNGKIGIFEKNESTSKCFRGVDNALPIKKLFLVGDSTYPGHSTVCSVRSGFEILKVINK